MRAHSSSRDAELMGVIESVQLGKNEMGIYRLLARGPLTIKEIIRRTHLSERMIRTHLDDLMEKKFVYKKPVIANNLKYVYYGNPEETIADMLLRKIREIESRKRAVRSRFRR
jgi:predicted DNA-binding transcriptional regulator